MNIGDKLPAVGPLLKLGGLDLGGVDLELHSRGADTAFLARYVGVEIGFLYARPQIDNSILWHWGQLS
jgi:hypothetical protein